MKSATLFAVVLTLVSAVTAWGVKWPSPEEEARDEVMDRQLLEAVRTSMSQWQQQRHRRKRANKSVCYGELGCFEDSGPFGYLDMLPSSPEEISTRFLIYSTKQRGDRPLLDVPYQNMSAIWENDVGIAEDLREAPTRIIIHGFGSTCSHVWVYEMRAALMAVEECTVLCVDWEAGAVLPNYVRAAANARLVGAQLAKLLQGMLKHQGISMSKVHMIGFSLGAHVAGFAGAQLPGLSRITGLDPAGPLFESQHPAARLDQSDATFVDVIHSNGENLILGGLGSWQPMGHVDFYPNGGRVQHGCTNLFVGAVTDIIWSAPAADEGRSLCNHRRAYKFFTDSVAPRCLFPAFPCSSYDDFLQGRCFACSEHPKGSDKNARCGNMGYYADRSTGRGQLFLLTREEEPFCAHQYFVRVDSTGGHLPLRSLGRLAITLEGDGGLNETFPLTEKDDTELQAGSSLSRLLVPHPALGPPNAVTLTYKAYSGWLSNGLPRWPVSRVSIYDSFGKSTSVCKRGLVLESGVPMSLPLFPGECNVPTQHSSESTTDIANASTDTDSEINSTEVPSTQEAQHSELHPITTSEYKKDKTTSAATNNQNNPVISKDRDGINLEDKFKIRDDDQSALLEAVGLLDLPWQPLLGGSINSLDGDSKSETSRSLEIKDEIVEPLLKPIVKNKIGRSHDLASEISEPVLSSTTKPIVRNLTGHKIATGRKLDLNSHEDKVTHRTEDKNDWARGITVQLLPQRLAEILERAENYARNTFLPLISVHVPRFFRFGDDEPSTPRTPKYFPPLAKYAEETNKTGKVHTTRSLAVYKNKTQPAETNRTAKQEGNVQPIKVTKVEDTKNVTTQIPATTPTASHVGNATAKKDEIEKDKGSDPVLELAESSGIHIDLPTYRPTVDFGYAFETPSTEAPNFRQTKSKYIPVTYPSDDAPDKKKEK